MAPAEISVSKDLGLPEDWDATVAKFESGSVYHTTGWLDFLAKTQGAKPAIEPFSVDGVECMNVGAMVSKGPFKILGSPLPGWTTARMGPLFDPEALEAGAMQKLVDALDRFGKAQRVSMFEVVNRHLDSDLMRANGWDEVPDATYVVDLPGSEEELWNHIKSTCRNRIRKARNNGLTVQFGVDDQLVDDVWQRVEAVFRHQSLEPSYDRKRIQMLYDSLAPRDQLVGVRVLAPDGHIAACGIFPFDARCIYFWAGAATPEDRALVPNELMHWELMCEAVRRGLKTYDMCGGGDYKKKYGAYLLKTPHWIRYYNPVAKLGRATVAGVVRTKRVVVGKLRR